MWPSIAMWRYGSRSTLAQAMAFCLMTPSHYMNQCWLHISEVSWTWWRHQMKTFSALLAICAGNSPVLDEFPAQRPVARRFDVFFDLRLNKRLSKQWWGWWFETLSCPLWRHCNVLRLLPHLPRVSALIYHNMVSVAIAIADSVKTAWIGGHFGGLSNCTAVEV